MHYLLLENKVVFYFLKIGHAVLISFGICLQCAPIAMGFQSCLSSVLLKVTNMLKQFVTDEKLH